jgi:two-component system response regulator DevR
MKNTGQGATGDAPVRVLIVDDHEVLAVSLAQVLSAEPGLISVGVAGTIAQAKAMIPTATPDVMLLDHRLPDGDGVTAIPELRALRPTMHVVVLTASAADSVLVAAMEAGASGFLSKTRGLAEVTSAVRAAALGEAVISPEMLMRLLSRLTRGPGGARAGYNDLTDREREVLALLAEGLTNAAIAARMFVSVHTVRNHIANLSHKLGAHSKLEALSIAVREGVLPGR